MAVTYEKTFEIEIINELSASVYNRVLNYVLNHELNKNGSSSECENAISYPLFMTGCKEMKTGCKHANDRPFGPLGGPGAVFTCSHPCTSPVWRVSRDRAA